MGRYLPTLPVEQARGKTLGDGWLPGKEVTVVIDFLLTGVGCVIMSYVVTDTAARTSMSKALGVTKKQVKSIIS